MHEPDPNHIAQRVLRKLAKYYLIDGIEEVVVNKARRSMDETSP